MEQHDITWRGIALAITFSPEKFGMIDHIELHTKDNAPLPVTETGYRSHFIACGTVAAHGGAIAFVTAWLDHEGARIGWSGTQLSLF